ncbi:MAG: methyltransferase domain-containing protein [Streptosporangiaceae bacterium]
MPTVPSERAPSSEREPHQAREIAESFGTDAERYDRARPRYPDPLVDRIVTASPGPDVLDVGCGTGIAARQFQAAGCTVLGVDPDARMAEFARRSGVEVEVTTFEAWDPAGRAFDAVVAGRVVPDSPFNSQAATRPALDVYQEMFTTFADGIREAGGFSDPEQWRFDWEHSYTRDEWLDLLPTQGPLTRLPQDKLTKVLEGVGAAIDTIGGSFTMPYTTVAVTSARTEPPESLQKVATPAVTPTRSSPGACS